MYLPLNDQVIVRKPNEKVTDSGIILSEQKDIGVYELTVVASNHSELLGKIVYAKNFDVHELPSVDGEHYGAVDMKKILAVKA